MGPERHSPERQSTARQSLVKTSTSVVKIQAVAHRSWMKALAALDDLPRNPSAHLLMMFRTGYHLCQVKCPEALMQAVLDDCVTALEAQRGSIVLADEVGTLHLRAVARGQDAPRFDKWFSNTLVQRCYGRGESILCKDVDRDLAKKSRHSVLRQNMSSIICALLRTPRKKLGVLHLDRGPWQPPFTVADLSLADAIAASVSSGLETAQLLDRQRELFLHTVSALARAVEIRDQYTGNHTQRVTDYSLLLAAELGLSEEDRQTIRIGTPLHDIGKIGIPDNILRKAGALTRDEFQSMKSHPVIGATLLQGIPGLRPTLPIIRHHHERWDGKGYPDRLASEDIPPLARVVAVADAFDAMTSDRPYRPALSFPTAFAEIAQEAGTHFAPECSRAFLGLRPRIEGQRH